MVELKRAVASINCNRDWAYCGTSSLKSFFASMRGNVHVSCLNTVRKQNKKSSIFWRTSYSIRCCQRSFTVNDQIYRLKPLSYFRFTLCNLLVTNRKVALITITFCSASSGFRGGVCSRAANTSNSGSGGPGFKPPRSVVSFS